MTAAERILPLLEGVRGRGADRWATLCPAHDDHSPSLTIRRTHDRILLRCWSGCTTRQVVEAVGLTLADLFDNHGKDYRRYRPDSAAIRRCRGFSKWRWDEVLRTALELRSRDQWILAITAAVEGGVLTQDEALDKLAVHYLNYSYLEWRLGILNSTPQQALEVWRGER